MAKKKDVSAAARLLGSIGGAKAAGAGWRAYAAKKTPQELSELARKAALVRWAKTSPEQRLAHSRKMQKAKRRGRVGRRSE
jgi:hypothetical protein